MQFKVPQFLDIEDKIFGPFTVSQFVYLAGGAGLCFILYRLLGLLMGFIPMALVAGLVIALVYYKPNGKPFVDMLEAGLKYMMDDKLYIWKRRKSKIKQAIKAASEEKTQSMENTGSKLTGSKLSDLAWSLDVLDLKKEKQD